MEYHLHQVNWNDEKVKRFWDFYNNYEAFEDLWFSKMVGKQIIDFVNKYHKIKGNVLDYGIGKGHLSSYLMENDAIDLFACDFSGDTVKNINSQFDTKENFKGCFLVKSFPSEFQDSKFDFVFLIEAIEHLTDEYLNPTLKEINRILKPGGVVVVTTPNNENLSLQHVSCPDCGCIYHRVQHVRSFNKSNLNEIMDKFNFKRTFCDAVDFEDFKKSPLIRFTKRIGRSIIGSKYQFPHLVYIGTR